MKPTAASVFDQRQAALELGYSEQEIEDFNNLYCVINFWSDELEDGNVKNSDFPVIDEKRLEALRKYGAGITNKKLEFYRKNKHLFT